jgi:hypothetical protein
MRIDVYTKTVLTVIAVCLVWIALGGSSLLSAAQAQGTSVQNVRVVGWQTGSSSVANVRIVGWGSSGGSSRELPLPVIPKPD